MQGMLQLLRLIDSLGKVEGRKKLQKIVHILQARGYDFPQHYGYLHYGPFSSDVAAETDALVSGQLITQKGEGQPMEAYVYSATNAARKLLTDLKQLTEPKWKALATDLNKKAANELEAISTILFLQRNGFEGDRLKTRFKELKPALVTLYGVALKSIQKFPTAR